MATATAVFLEPVLRGCGEGAAISSHRLPGFGCLAASIASRGIFRSDIFVAVCRTRVRDAGWLAPGGLRFQRCLRYCAGGVSCVAGAWHPRTGGCIGSPAVMPRSAVRTLTRRG